jgi:hypothetical protein
MKLLIYAVVILCGVAMYATNEETHVPALSILQIYAEIKTPIQHSALESMEDQTVQICKPSPIPVIASTRFAVVSMLSVPHAVGYIKGAAKLGVSLRSFSTMNMVMLAVNMGDTAPELIRDAGWMWCDVPPIGGPTDGIQSRYTDAFMYTKLWTWSLTEYEAVLFIDSDCIVLSDFSQVFNKHFQEMKVRGVEVAMARDSPQESTNTCPFWDSQSLSSFNAGVVIMIPSIQTYSSMVDAIHTLPHNTAQAEQGLMVAYFEPSPDRLYRIYVLPWYFNYNLVSVYCEPGMHSFEEMVIVHFTVSKPWEKRGGEWSCDTWHTEDYCLLWESLPLSLGQLT